MLQMLLFFLSRSYHVRLLTFRRAAVTFFRSQASVLEPGGAILGGWVVRWGQGRLEVGTGESAGQGR